jgi:hypothetical protein
MVHGRPCDRQRIAANPGSITPEYNDWSVQSALIDIKYVPFHRYVCGDSDTDDSDTPSWEFDTSR